MDVVEALLRCGGVADRAALDALTSRAQLDSACASGDVLRTAQGRYALPTADEAIRAAHSVAGTIASRSAAAWWGWELKGQPPRPEISVPRHRRRVARVPMTVTWVDLHPSEVHEHLVTTQERTLVDCLRRLPFDEALAVADSALRHGFPRDLLLAVAASVRGPGAPRVRRVAAAASGLAANPFESVLRALAVDAGLDVVPQVGIWVCGEYVRPDVVDESRGLILEADSFTWHGKRSALRRDARRYTEMVVEGWRVLRFAYEDVMHDQPWVMRVLEAARAHEGRTHVTQRARRAG